MSNFKYSRLDFLFTCVGLVLLLLDISLDVWAAVSFYQEKAYFSLGLLALFLMGSSVLVQTFSWLWYSYEDFDRSTNVEKAPSLGLLRILHVFQLGIYLRHLGVVEMSVLSFTSPTLNHEDVAVFLNHDLAMLRIVETFSESLPQLVLMVATNVQHEHLDPVTVLKAVGSAMAVAFTVTTYHRTMRAFIPNQNTMNLLSSVVYFLWNLLLISARVTALALFASVLPCFILTHFLCSWLVLFFSAWRSQTNFMESPGGEWLYRATVGLIWYFNWFNVVKGSTRSRTLLYHGYIIIDICLLCGLWFWKMNPELPDFNIYHVITSVCVVSVYFFGLLLKTVYYEFCHPTLSKQMLENEEQETSPVESNYSLIMYTDEVDAPECDPENSAQLRMASNVIRTRPTVTVQTHTQEKKTNKRMRKLAENFYS